MKILTFKEILLRQALITERRPILSLLLPAHFLPHQPLGFLPPRLEVLSQPYLYLLQGCQCLTIDGGVYFVIGLEVLVLLEGTHGWGAVTLPDHVVGVAATLLLRWLLLDVVSDESFQFILGIFIISS